MAVVKPYGTNILRNIAWWESQKVLSQKLPFVCMCVNMHVYFFLI